jgi:hypothetical protein
MEIGKVPDAVALGVAGILGGVGGEPVGLSLRDYPVDVGAALWGYLTRLLLPGQVVEVTGRRDLRRFSTGLDRVRAVLVYPSGGRMGPCDTIDWMVERRRGSGHPLPAVLSLAEAVQESPGARLVLFGGRDDVQGLAGWLGGEDRDDACLRHFFQRTWDGELTVPQGPAARLRRATAVWASPGIRTAKILSGLMSGQQYWKQARGERTGTPESACVEAYLHAWRWLQGPSVHNPDATYDPLLHAMLRRANAYLTFKVGRATPALREGRGGEASQVDREGLRDAKRAAAWITNRELADLGNPLSAVVEDLLLCLTGTADVEAFQRLGLKQDLPPDFSWPSEVRSLAKFLRPWTMKQVRDRFLRLRQRGFVDTDRSAGNAALRYRLPRELIDLASPYQELPSVERLVEWLAQNGPGVPVGRG